MEVGLEGLTGRHAVAASIGKRLCSTFYLTLTSQRQLSRARLLAGSCSDIKKGSESSASTEHKKDREPMHREARMLADLQGYFCVGAPCSWDVSE